MVFASSFGAEDMVLFDLIARDFREIEIATLDTGRLPPETYDLIQQASLALSPQGEDLFPAARRCVESFVRVNGINGFYDSISQRKGCCEVRKLEPLKRALAGKRAWITGLRRDQSVTRQALEEVAFDETQGLYKFNPLADWSEQDVWNYIRSRNVPYNALHDRGYPSIGCAPCTRAVAEGRRRARRPLVVGIGRGQGMRATSTRSEGMTQASNVLRRQELDVPATSQPRTRGAPARGGRGRERGRERRRVTTTSTGSRPKRSTSCARSPPSARTPPCSSRAARIRSSCCASRRKRSVPAASRSRCSTSTPATTFPS